MWTVPRQAPVFEILIRADGIIVEHCGMLWDLWGRRHSWCRWIASTESFFQDYSPAQLPRVSYFLIHRYAEQAARQALTTRGRVAPAAMA